MRAIRLALNGARTFAVIVCYMAVAALVLGALLLGISFRSLRGARGGIEDPLPAHYEVTPATELPLAGGPDPAGDRRDRRRSDGG